MAEPDETRGTVLIAEDEVMLAKAIAATLDLEGLHTVLAHDGEDALKAARRLMPDVILLDVMMPRKSGIEVCASLKTNPETASIPVIMLTAKADDTDRAVGMAAGADAYITKPFSPVQLIDLVDEALAGRPITPQARQPDIADMPTDQLVVYARDLKELFEQEREERRALEVAHRRLEELDQLKASFISVVTHELLSPFGSIGLALEVLQREAQSSSSAGIKEALEDLSTRIAGLHRLVNGVVKFAELLSKRREPRPGNIALHQVIPSAVQPVAVMAQGRDVDFRLLVPDDLPRVYADPELVSEAVFQMAHNAVKFNLAGGSALVKAIVSREFVVIKVVDTGIGLSEERLETLGEPFEQEVEALRRGEEGLGIGWAFVQYVAEVHDGWTHVESEGPDQGSTFFLALPTVEPGNDEP